MNTNINKLVQIVIVCFMFPMAVGSGIYSLVTPKEEKSTEPYIGIEKTEPEVKTIQLNPKSNCKIPDLSYIDTDMRIAIDTANNTLHRTMAVLPESNGTYMEVTNSKSGVKFEKFFGNQSSFLVTNFCEFNQTSTPVELEIYFGPDTKSGQMLDYKELYKIGTYTGNKMYFNVPANQQVYISTHNDIFNK